MAALISKHPLYLPITDLSLLPDGRVAGLVNTKSKKGRKWDNCYSSRSSSGIAVYELSDGQSEERISPKTFKSFEPKYAS